MTCRRISRPCSTASAGCYVFGSELLSVIAPPSEADETVRIPVEENFADPLERIDGIDAGSFLLRQMQTTAKILREKQPDKVIVFVGDCSIYPGEPYSDVNAFPAAVGRMTLKEVGRVLGDVGEAAERVGLSITEHLPWDAFNLRKTLDSLSIFK